MTKEERKFYCHQAAEKGLFEITEEYCLNECNSVQRGLKAECPDSVRPKLAEENQKDD